MTFSKTLVTLCLLIGFSNPVAGQTENPDRSPGQPTLEWQELSPIPNSVGLAGPVVGVYKNTLIVGGGANFPEGVPWHPGTDGRKSVKIYHDKIYLKRGDEDWVTSSVRLPQPLAYGSSVSIAPSGDQTNGILVFGGQCETHSTTSGETETTFEYLDDVFCLTLDQDHQVVVSNEFNGRPLPELPFATTSLVAGQVGNSIYVLTGETEAGSRSELWRLDLSADELGFGRVAEFPGQDRGFAVGVVQNDGREDCLFVFSGRSKNLGKFELFTDFWKYVPSEDRWFDLGEIKLDQAEDGLCLMAGFGIAYGANHVLLGGGDQEVFKKLNVELLAEIERERETGNEDEAQQLEAERTELLDSHPGFDRDVLAFNAVTNKFYVIGQFAEAERLSTAPGEETELTTGSHVTTTAVMFDGQVVIPSGEIAPGVRSDRVWSFQVAPIEQGLGVLNWSVMGAYLLLLVGIGFYFSRGTQTSDDYFLGGGRVPWWAAGLSVFATMLSAITYIAIPARAYGTDWAYFLVAMGIPLVCIFVMYFYLPHFRKLNLTSAYEYLEARFHWTLRIFGALTFVAFQFGRMGIVVLIPALALSAVTGLNVYACIVTMGFLATVYTVLGGVEAVIWTDVLQTFVLFGGAIAAILIVAGAVEGGLGEIFSQAAASGKLTFVRDWNNHDLSWTKDGILVLLIGAVFSNLLPYSSDQAVVQRYMTVKDEPAARRAIWVNALMCIPASFLFYTVGASLYVFFSQQPETLAPLAKSDQIFPWFFFFQLPAGLAGLVFAGVLAAAMSSLDSSMHSIATVVSTDFYKRFRADVDDKDLLKFAKRLTIILGVIGTAAACAMASVDIKYLLDLFLDIVGVALGPLGGLFALGIFVKRCNTFHAWIAVLVSTALLVLVNGMLPSAGFGTRLVHPLVNGGVAMGACVVTGWILSVLIPLKSKSVVASE
jgi:SSS family transporter